MGYLDTLFGAHAQNLGRAMDRATLRHSLLTKNLANVNTPGYKRQDVDFGVVLADSEKRTAKGASGSSEEEITITEGRNRVDGNSVGLEQEVTALAETELRYQMLTDMTARYFSGLKNVIREGR